MRLYELASPTPILTPRRRSPACKKIWAQTVISRWSYMAFSNQWLTNQTTPAQSPGCRVVIGLKFIAQAPLWQMLPQWFSHQLQIFKASIASWIDMDSAGEFQLYSILGSIVPSPMSCSMENPNLLNLNNAAALDVEFTSTNHFYVEGLSCCSRLFVGLRVFTQRKSRHAAFVTTRVVRFPFHHWSPGLYLKQQHRLVSCR